MKSRRESRRADYVRAPARRFRWKTYPEGDDRAVGRGNTPRVPPLPNFDVRGPRGLTSFACGSAPLDGDIREQAAQDMRRLLAKCFVALAAGENRVLGFYALAAASPPLDLLAPDLRYRLPCRPAVPVARVFRPSGPEKAGAEPAMTAEPSCLFAGLRLNSKLGVRAKADSRGAVSFSIRVSRLTLYSTGTSVTGAPAVPFRGFRAARGRGR